MIVRMGCSYPDVDLVEWAPLHHPLDLLAGQVQQTWSSLIPSWCVGLQGNARAAWLCDIPRPRDYRFRPAWGRWGRLESLGRSVGMNRASSE